MVCRWLIVTLVFLMFSMVVEANEVTECKKRCRNTPDGVKCKKALKNPGMSKTVCHTVKDCIDACVKK